MNFHIFTLKTFLNVLNLLLQYKKGEIFSILIVSGIKGIDPLGQREAIQFP